MKLLNVFLSGLLVLAAAPLARAESFHTTFRATMWINNTPIPITSEGRIALPGTLAAAGWACMLTSENISDDGVKSYRNIGCLNGINTVITSATCRRSRVDTDDGNFSIIVGKTRVEFLIICSTQGPSPGGTSL